MNRSYAVPPFALEIRVGSLEQRLNLVFARLWQKKHFLRCPKGLLSDRFQVIPGRNFLPRGKVISWSGYSKNSCNMPSEPLKNLLFSSHDRVKLALRFRDDTHSHFCEQYVVILTETTYLPLKNHVFYPSVASQWMPDIHKIYMTNYLANRAGYS